MRTQFPLPASVKPLCGERGWAEYKSQTRGITRKKQVPAHHYLSGMYGWWAYTYGWFGAANNRALRAYLAWYWHTQMPFGGKMSWEAAAQYATYFNYKSHLAHKGKWLLFYHHHTLKASALAWDAFPGPLLSFEFQPIAPAYYPMPVTPEIETIQDVGPGTWRVTTNNIPEEMAIPGDQYHRLRDTPVQVKMQDPPPPTIKPMKGYMAFPAIGALQWPYNGKADLYVFCELPYFLPRTGKNFALSIRYMNPTTYICSDPCWFSVREYA